MYLYVYICILGSKEGMVYMLVALPSITEKTVHCVRCPYILYEGFMQAPTKIMVLVLVVDL